MQFSNSFFLPLLPHLPSFSERIYEGSLTKIKTMCLISLFRFFTYCDHYVWHKYIYVSSKESVIINLNLTLSCRKKFLQNLFNDHIL